MAQSQFHTFLDYPDTYPLPGLIVPQSVFHALGEPFQPRPPIRFSENGTGGVSLQNALSPTTTTGGGGLAANTNQVGVPQLTGKTVLMACRIQWPGYPPWTENILLSADMRLIVHNVATAIKHFMDDMARVVSSETQPDWSISTIEFSTLYLLELRHVGGPNWQPVLCRRIRS